MIPRASGAIRASTWSVWSLDSVPIWTRNRGGADPERWHRASAVGVVCDRNAAPLAVERVADDDLERQRAHELRAPRELAATPADAAGPTGLAREQVGARRREIDDRRPCRLVEDRSWSLIAAPLRARSSWSATSPPRGSPIDWR